MKLSIITINYNNASGLERTIESIVDKLSADIEYIVIDGYSTDSSVNVIQKYCNSINYWVSESDKGVYSAMNKGIKQAKGEYLLFINSGDKLKKGICLIDILNKGGRKDIVYTNLEVVSEDGTSYIKTYPNLLNLHYFIDESLPHPACFIKKDLFSKYGYYDENLKICSDWTFFVKVIIKQKASYCYLNTYFSVFFTDGISSRNNELIVQEKQAFLKSLYFPFWTFFKRYIFWISRLANKK